MMQHAKYLSVVIVLTCGILLSNSAIAAVAHISGDFLYSGETKQLSMAFGTVLPDSDSIFIPDPNEISFESTWNGTTFTNSSLTRLSDGQVLLTGTETSQFFSLPTALFVTGSYTTISGLWEDEFLVMPEFIMTLNLFKGQTFTDMSQNYSGRLTIKYTAPDITTPIPTSLTLLGLGLVGIAGLKRRKN